ncbi:MAG: flagellar motor switch phosphatase FliY [Eubacterium sp.]|jgi:flagellar motor switch protein FliN/FliY|nr:flagellar motor switch phosphatase FliY [Eubacterium sp.]
MDGMLSQDEINALLNGMSADDSADNETSETPQESNESASDNTPNTDKPEALSDTEKDAVGEISNISMGTAATTLSSLLNQKVNITTPRVEVADWDKLSRKYDRPCVMLQIRYKEGIDGNNVLILKERDVKIITDLMMGGTGNVDDGEELTDLHLSAIGEAMNQMMGSAATSLSSMFNRKIDISPPIANIVETYNEMDETLPQFLNDNFVIVAFKMQIGDLIDSEIMQLYPIDFAKELLTMFSIDQEAQSDNSSASTEPTPAEQTAAPQPQAATAPQQPMPDMSQQGMMQQGMMQQGMPMQGMPYGYGMPMQGMPYGYGMPMQQAPVKDVNVSPASFQPFQADVNPLVQQENIDLIMDVPLEVTVELGRVSKSIKDILDFAPGTIVELNKIAGEAVDVLVNGKYVAKGEVVVIEENFGVRITEIIK